MEGIKPRSAVEQFARRPITPKHEPEVEEAMEAFQEARARSREALMLDVHLKDGTIESFDYASLRRATYRPDGVLLLRFLGGEEVTAEGRNLSRLRESLTEHRLRYLREGIQAESDLKPEDAPHIERIVIVEGEGR